MTLVKDDTQLKQGFASIIIKADDVKEVKNVAEAVTKLGFGATTAENMINQMNHIFFFWLG